MLRDLEAAVTKYNNSSEAVSARMQVVDNQLVVAICTPLMKRILANASTVC